MSAAAQPRPRWGRGRVALLAAAIAVFAGLYAKIASSPAPARFVLPERAGVAPPENAPRYEVLQVTSGATPFAHSVAVVELPDGALRAFWFGGSREGATDAAIYSAIYAPRSASWGAAALVVTPRQVQADVQRWVRKIGNPAVVRGRDDQLHLYFVSVAAGGWAASAINTMASADGGASWTRARRFVTSPFLNFSTLVKGAPVLYDDGHLGVPAYHEFAAKFGELLHVTPSGELLGKTRLTAGDYSLQPVIVPRSAREAVGFMRYSGEPPGRVLVLRTADGGLTWSAAEKTSLPNPNSAVDALRLEDGTVLLAFNNTEEDRNDLSLARSPDEGRTWRAVRRIEHSPDPRAEFSYPRLVRTSDGDFHLLYTVNKALIRHARFNRAWLERVLP